MEVSFSNRQLVSECIIAGGSFWVELIYSLEQGQVLELKVFLRQISNPLDYFRRGSFDTVGGIFGVVLFGGFMDAEEASFHLR